LCRRVKRCIEFAAGFGKDQLAQQVRPPLGHAERDVTAARMPHQIDRSGIELFDKADHVGDVLRDRIGVAMAVPVFGKKMPQAERDHAMPFRQRSKHRRPDPEIA